MRKYSLIFLIFLSGIVRSNVTVENPGEYAPMIQTEALIKDYMKKQDEFILETTSINGSLYKLNRKMANWEKEYNFYLTQISGFAQQLKGNASVYLNAVQILMSLNDLRKAIKDNPQALLTNNFMNEMYIRTGVEFLRTFKIMSNFCDSKIIDMKNGGERVKYLWELNASMEQLNRDLRQAAICVSLSSWQDVWNKAVAGKIQKTPGMIAKEAHQRMFRSIDAIRKRLNW